MRGKPARPFSIVIGTIMPITIIALLVIWLVIAPDYQPTAFEMTAQAISTHNIVTLPVYFVTRTPAAAAAPPTYFYYSTNTEAFIISSADGEQDRILAEYRLPDSCYAYDNCNVAGAGFSPSMKWFAWTSDNSAAYPTVETQAFVAHVDSGTKDVLLDGAGEIMGLSWSPINDELLIMRFDFDTANFIYYVWDTETTREIAAHPEQSTWIEWTPDGQLVSYLKSQDDVATHMFISDTSGTVAMERDIADIRGEFPPFSCRPTWSKMGKTILVDVSNDLTVINVANNEEFTIDFPDRYVVHVEWNSQDDYALVFSSDSCDWPDRSFVANLWLLSYDNQTITLLSDAAIPRLFWEQQSPYDSSWSTAGNRLFYLTTRNEQETLVVTSLPDLTSSEVYTHTEPYSYMRLGHIHWLQNGQLAFWGLSGTGEDTIFLYDVEEMILSTLVTGDLVDMIHSFSPDERLIAFGNCDGICIFDMDSNESTHVTPLQERATDLGLGLIDDFFWSSDSQWLLVTSDRVGAGYRLHLVDATNMNYRTLDGWVTLSQPSFGWLESRPTH